MDVFSAKGTLLLDKFPQEKQMEWFELKNIFWRILLQHSGAFIWAGQINDSEREDNVLSLHHAADGKEDLKVYLKREVKK